MQFLSCIFSWFYVVYFAVFSSDIYIINFAFCVLLSAVLMDIISCSCAFTIPLPCIELLY